VLDSFATVALKMIKKVMQLLVRSLVHISLRYSRPCRMWNNV